MIQKIKGPIILQENQTPIYEEKKCGGSVGGDKDCKVNGVWADVTVTGWSDANKTFDDAKEFCNGNDSCVGIAQSSDNWNWPITRTDLFIPCDGVGCDPQIKYFDKKVNLDSGASTANCSEYESRDDCPVGCKWDMYDVKCKDETPKEKCDRELDMICVSHFQHAMSILGYFLFGLLCLGVALMLIGFCASTYMSVSKKTSNSEYFSDVSSVLTSISQL